MTDASPVVFPKANTPTRAGTAPSPRHARSSEEAASSAGALACAQAPSGQGSDVRRSRSLLDRFPSGHPRRRKQRGAH